MNLLEFFVAQSSNVLGCTSLLEQDFSISLDNQGMNPSNSIGTPQQTGEIMLGPDGRPILFMGMPVLSMWPPPIHYPYLSYLTGILYILGEM